MMPASWLSQDRHPMFERNRVDNANDPTVAIEVGLAGGRTITGRAALGKGKALHRLLDGDEKFLFVDCFEGEAQFVAKAEITSVKVIPTQRPRALNLPLPDASNFDPHRILGVQKGAPWDEIRAAYHRMTKLYHPDKFESVELPDEVRAYLVAMTKEVNVAFRTLRSAASGGRAA
jgi:DnaJ-domain-containing protein 1